MSENQKEVKTWWADLLTPDELEEYDCMVGTLMSEHPRQGPLDWQASLFQVVPKSDFDAVVSKLRNKDSDFKEISAKYSQTVEKYSNLVDKYEERVNEIIEFKAEIQSLKQQLNTLQNKS